MAATAASKLGPWQELPRRRSTARASVSHGKVLRPDWGSGSGDTCAQPGWSSTSCSEDSESTTVDLLTGCPQHGPDTHTDTHTDVLRWKWQERAGGGRATQRGDRSTESGHQQPQLQGLPEPLSDSMICWEDSELTAGCSAQSYSLLQEVRKEGGFQTCQGRVCGAEARKYARRGAHVAEVLLMQSGCVALCMEHRPPGVPRQPPCAEILLGSVT